MQATCLFVLVCILTKLVRDVTCTVSVARYLQGLLALHSGCNVPCQVCHINSPYRDAQGRLLNQVAMHTTWLSLLTWKAFVTVVLTIRNILAIS